MCLRSGIAPGAEWAERGDLEPVPEYWPLVQKHKKIAIAIGEGAKKAGAQITAGVPTIALPGVWQGHVQKDSQGEPLAIDDYLAIPELSAALGEGRKVALVFDQDSSPTTRAAVSD